MKSKRSDADRRLRQADRLARVLRILRKLQGHGRYDVKALAAEEECSERTVFRVLDVLELAGIPVEFDHDHRCYSLRSDFRFPVLNLSEDELLGQAAATSISKGPGLQVGKGPKPTTEKLAAASREEVGQLLADAEEVVAVLDLKLADHSRHLDMIRTVQSALVKKRQLSGLYRSPYEAGPVKVVLHPFRLALVKACWYLIGRPDDGDQPLTYRIPRFQALRTLERTSDVPNDFDLKAYFGNAWAVFRGEKSYSIELMFTKQASDLVTETVWHHTQEVRRHKNGSVTLTFQVDGLNELVRWLLGWSGKVKIVKPDELRELVTKQLQAALKMNGP